MVVVAERGSPADRKTHTVLTCHLQPQGGLVVGCVLPEDAVISPVIKHGDIVYHHSGLSSDHAVADECGPSPVFHHLLFIHIVSVLVHMHSWRGLVPVPPQLHALSTDVG